MANMASAIKLDSRGLGIRAKRCKAYGVSALVLSPKEPAKDAPGVLWIHGGGYMLGLKEMVYMSRALDLVQRHGAVVVAPDYRLSVQAPYPAALNDCYLALLWLVDNAEGLGVNPSQIMVGGESAGGGLAAALCMMARDAGTVNVAFQMPLYPMTDNFDTETSKDNHAKVWNTERNHLGWRLYLREKAHCDVSPYAAPARQSDYADLPPAYTFVSTAEPFLAETVEYIENLKAAGVEADIDTYEGLFHAFDMLRPDLEQSQEAIRRFNERFDHARRRYFADQPRWS